MPVVRMNIERVDGKLIIRMGKANRYGIGGRVKEVIVDEREVDQASVATQMEEAYEALLTDGGR